MEKINLPQDFKDLLKLLISHKVKFLLIGGYAVVYHGFPRYTGDLDIWVEISKDNADKIVSALKEFGFDIPELSSELFLNKGKMVRMGEEPVRIEILTEISGLDFASTFEQREEMKIEDLIIPVISLENLRKNKKESGRSKDLLDLENLPE